MHESSDCHVISIGCFSYRLSISRICFKDLFMGYGSFSNFWEGSILFLEPLSTKHPPDYILYLTPFLVTISIPFSYYIFLKNKSLIEGIVNSNNQFTYF